jgi:hypothetical protein
MTAILVILGFIFITYIIGCLYVTAKAWKKLGFMAIGIFITSLCFTPFFGNWALKNCTDPPGFK